MANNQTDILNKLFEEYDLVFDKNDPKNSDVFVSPRYKIITRSGIDKIQAKTKANAEFDVVYVDPYEIIVKGKFTLGDTVIETFGEASVDRKESYVLTESFTINGESKSRQKVETTTLKKGNVGQNPPYLAAMAEKRARSRGILRLAGLYDHGFYGEDEADDFGAEVRKQRSSVKVT